jgi:glycyl-tRNA synthetase
MSNSYYKFGGLRFWNEDEIELRELIITRFSGVIKRTLTELNPAWRYFRTEGPILTPAEFINSEYTEDDLFLTNHKNWALRAETTASSYEVARRVGGKLPICVWQVGKSFRRELSDGATASKLRFNEFYQMEFQCIYAENTMADYRDALIKALTPEVARMLGHATKIRIVESDRLPSYSESTLDIEVEFRGNWKEVASCSIRNDYANQTKVCEIAFGLDRLVEIGLQTTS